jgi:hypothetical protein
MAAANSVAGYTGPARNHEYDGLVAVFAPV